MHRNGKRTVCYALVLVLLSAVAVTAKPPAKKLTTAISVNVRTNKRGAKVDLSKAPGYKQAVMDFYARKYGPAARQFEEIDAHGFCCDMVHYYIAQCYHQLNQLALAQMHYSWVVTYSKDATLRAYSQNAYAGLQYYGNHRTYSGQGNTFDRVTAGNYRPAGGSFG